MKFLKILIGLFLGLAIITGGFYFYGQHLYNQMDTEELELKEGETLVNEEVSSAKKDSSVMNIALFGVDSRLDSYEGTRSDAIMVLSYNKDTRKAYITSIVRDTYAFINETYGYDKINHAYSFGGPALAIQTLNNNFDLDIERYVSVNFNAVQKIIDGVGGITLTVKDYEINEINRVIREMQAEGVFKTAPTLSYAGEQTLNGQQTLAYMRIRKVGNGDFERMERQRRVMNLLFEKVQAMSKTDLLQLAQELLPSIKTNLPYKEAISQMTDLVFNGIDSVEQYQLPYTDLSYGAKLSDGIYYLVPTPLTENIVEWHKQVYGVEAYQPSSLAGRISEQIANYTGIY